MAEFHSGQILFIAGETGLVGSALVRRFSREPIEILPAPHKKLDLTDRAATFAWFSAHRPDFVIMAAGRVGGIGANAADPLGFYHDNLAMARNVIDAAAYNKVNKLLFMGSSCIYPRNAPQPLTPDSLFKGRLEKTNQGYALAKLKAIRLCQAYRTQGHDFISVLPCNLYGPNDTYDAQRSHVIPALVLKIGEAKRTGAPHVTLWGTGTPLREFLHVDDLAEACAIAMCEYSDATPLNIGSGEEISIHDLAHLIADALGYAGDIRFDPAYPDGTPRKVMDSEFMKGMGWIPTIGLFSESQHDKWGNSVFIGPPGTGSSFIINSFTGDKAKPR